MAWTAKMDSMVVVLRVYVVLCRRVPEAAQELAGS